ncbi:hypothetical protein GDO86_020495 [Hymenochirus boettgeri]|uniref:Taste receptor type 2 n=1 Tax=Hymenochirus boettgeri TaxID=247094 RepID=A0A8T2IEP2_9PIPI|nr:hypothetical protein GDO86_020495 [Hymenochirus boettgeri]
MTCTCLYKTTEMLSALNTVKVAAFTNGYIAVVLLLDSFKCKNMSSSTKILVALSISNVCFALISSANLVISLLWPQLYTDFYVKRIMLALTMYGMISSCWLTTCLCVFYFIKIIHFTSSLFVWIKMKISTIVPWFIFFAKLMSLGCSFLTLLPSVIYDSSSENISSISSFNDSGANVISLGFLSVAFIAMCVPMVTVIITTFLTALSLFLHYRKMERYSCTSSSDSLTAHHGAVWMMTRLLFLYIIIFVVMLVNSFYVFVTLCFAFWISIILMYSFTFVQSVLLVLGISKLKEALKQTCHWRVCCKQ